MIFKRKDAKPVGVGTICKIKESVVSKMTQEERYIQNSVSKKREDLNGFINRRDLRKNSSQNQVMVEDAELVYVGSNSIFGKDIVEVVPLKIKRDAYAYAIKHLLGSRKTFLMRKDALSLAGRQEILKFDEDHNYNVKDFVTRNLVENYGLTNFSW